MLSGEPAGDTIDASLIFAETARPRQAPVAIHPQRPWPAARREIHVTLTGSYSEAYRLDSVRDQLP